MLLHANAPIVLEPVLQQPMTLFTALSCSIEEAHTKPVQSRGISVLLILKLPRGTANQAILRAAKFIFFNDLFYFCCVCL